MSRWQIWVLNTCLLSFYHLIIQGEREKKEKKKRNLKAPKKFEVQLRIRLTAL